MARGTLRIYVGAAPGVGKTFAMLNEGRRRCERGTDVVVGLVETHGRARTAEQVGALEVTPRRVVRYRGVDIEELDIDALLERRPSVALIDELAHTNAPGSRNEKRWQDINELLAAGVDVISTVNIQHLESLNDVVEQITGVVQRERVPDSVVRSADQVELVDMSPEALRRRMAHGNIYPADRVDAALAHYFRTGNLGTLRELALLWVADRVDESLVDYRQRHGIDEPWETRERVVVALTGAWGAERLVRRGARMAARAHAELVGVHVRDVDALTNVADELNCLERHRFLVEEFGGRFVEVAGADSAEALVRVARAENATQLVMGSSHRSRWEELTRGSVINRVIRLAGPIDVHVISSPSPLPAREHLARRHAPRLAAVRSARSRLLAWLCVLVVIPVAVLALIPLREAMGVPGTLLLLLLGPVLVAVFGGLRPAVAASLVTFLLADWFYIAPTQSLRFAHAGDALALVVFVAVSALVSVLVDRLSTRTAQLAREQAEVEALVELASLVIGFDEASQHRLVVELQQALDVDGVALLAPQPEGWLVTASSGSPVPLTPDDASCALEVGDGTMLALSGRVLGPDERRILNAFVAHLQMLQATQLLAGPGRVGLRSCPGEQRSRGAACRGVTRPPHSARQHQGLGDQHPELRRRLVRRRPAVVQRHDRRGGRSAPQRRDEPARHESPPGRTPRSPARTDRGRRPDLRRARQHLW